MSTYVIPVMLNILAYITRLKKKEKKEEKKLNKRHYTHLYKASPSTIIIINLSFSNA
jgi:hypothetical protein